MRTVSRKVSLEPLITRYPVCYPAIKGGEIYYLSTDSLEEVENAHYGYIPLNVNEDITGSYSDFTGEMYSAYSGCSINCYTLQKWMVEFEDYYNMLRSDECHGEFESASDYYSKTYPDIYNRDEAEEIDDTFKKHGGHGFYNWLIDNYFVMLDLKNEYNIQHEVQQSCSYSEWCGFIDNIGRDRMPFPSAVEFFGKLSRMHELYSGTTDCSTSDDCCECVDYRLYGGETMYACVEEWMKRVCNNISANNNKILDYEDVKNLIPKTEINFQLTEKFEDLGVLVSFSQEFVPGRTYTSGETCTYEEITYIMDQEEYNKPNFVIKEGNTIYWKEYYDEYITKHRDEEDVDSTLLHQLSGRTVSSLDFFTRKEDTVDGIGNVLPGYFRPNVNSFFVQPAEDSLLGFIYQPGTFVNMELLSASDNEKLYKCDFLDRIEFFYRDLDGNIIDETRTSTSSVTINPHVDVNEKIRETKSIAESGETANTGVLYADFYYYKDAPVRFSFTFDEETGESGYTISSFSGYTEYVDHCTIQESSCQYCISETESYPLRYYKVNMDMETRFSDEYQREVNVYMCDFAFNLPEFYPCKHTATPLFRKEELLPFVNAETPVDNIYIDRGYATVLDRHLRIGEITNYEQLEKYGNGMFQIFNADEEVV